MNKPRPIVDPSPLDHIWYRLVSEWSLFPDPNARAAIAELIERHPEWGISVVGEYLTRIPPKNAPKTD